MGSRIATLVDKFGLHLVEDENIELTISLPDYRHGYEELKKERGKVEAYLTSVFSSQNQIGKHDKNDNQTRLFACYNTNDEIRGISSSGGIYYLLADKVIQDGGVVYAACYEGLRVKHIRIDKKEEIDQTCGAKYIQSDLGDTFKSIAVDLKNGRKVLFVGQPCQCAGLRQSVGQHDNLICVDFVCHGIPGKDVWQKYLELMKKHGISIRSVNMRDKSTGWKKYNWRIETEDGRIIIQPRTENAYMKGFLKDLYLRPSCYQCHFKGVVRQTDITLGDYWGIETAHPEMFDDKGVSLVMLHSEKGKDLFSKIKASLRIVETTVEKATKANPSIIISPMKPREADVFKARMEKGEDFCSAINELTRPNKFRDMATKVDRKIKRLKASKG